MLVLRGETMKAKNAGAETLRYYTILLLVLSAVCLHIVTGSSLYLITALVLLAAFSAFQFYMYKRADNTSGGIIPFGEIKELKEKSLVQKDEIEFLYDQSKAINDELRNSLNRITSIQSELEQKNMELEMLSEASEIITSTFEADAIIEYLYGVFNKFTGCDRYFISLTDSKTAELVCKYEFGQVTFNEVGNVYDEETSIKTCFINGQTVLKSNVFIQLRNSYGDKMAIPLNISGRLIGVIFIESGIPGTFSNINTEFIESMAVYAAIAINNAEMFNDIYMQKQEIESLYEQTAASNEQLNAYIKELSVTKEELNIKNSELTRFYDEMQTGCFQTVTALANSIQAKDEYTMGHCQRVMEIACQIATCMGFKEDEIDDLRYAAILHDIGKIGIPASILNKSERLSDDEYGEIKKHPLISFNILKDVEFIGNGLQAILQHHERFDGKGYPNGLKGNQICMFGRILCIADAFDAMTSDRPYRAAMSIGQALREIQRCRGTQFDPEISDLFITITQDLVKTDSFADSKACVD